MITIVFVSLFSIFLSLFLFLIRPHKRPKNYPPGPIRFGILGSLPNFILGPYYKDFAKILTKNYGGEEEGGEKVMIFDCVGPVPLVFINDAQVLKDSFGKNALYGRPPFGPAQCFKEPRGFAMRSGDHAKEIQKFAINELKALGFGKRSLGPFMAEEAKELVKLLRSHANSPLSTDQFFNISTLNVLWTIVTGERFSLDNEKAHQFMTIMSGCSQNLVKMAIPLVVPKLWRWIPVVFDDVKRGQSLAVELFMDLVQERRRNCTDAERARDFTDAFVAKIESTTDKNSAFYGDVAYENAVGTIVELYIGSVETNGVALSWVCLHLAMHPEKQEKLHREIDQVLQGQISTLEDKNKLPYVEAVINETLRKSPVLPFGVQRLTVEDTTIGGYNVPKDTLVFGNIYGIHNCPKTWGDPQNFRPERFLSPDEKSVIKHEAFVPMGAGKKRCPGEQLARDSLFIFLTSIFSHFSVSLNPNERPPNLDRKLEAVLHPPHHTLIFKERPKSFY